LIVFKRRKPPADVPPEERDPWRGVAAEEQDDVSGGLAAFLRRRSLRLLGSLLRPHLAGVIAGTILVVLNTLAVLTGPYLIKLAIDNGITPVVNGTRTSLGPFYAVAAAYGATALIDSLSLRYYLRITGRNGELILFDLRTRLFDHFQRLSMRFYEKYTSGRIIARLTSDIEALSELLANGFVTLATSALSLVGIAIILIRLDVQLAMVTLAVFPLVIGLTLWFRRHSEVAYRAVRDAIALVIIHFTESLGGIRAVHAYRREPRNQEIFDDVNGRYRDSQLLSVRLGSIYGPGVNFLGQVATVGGLLYGGYRVIGHQLTIGVLAAFLLYLRQFFQPIFELSQFYNQFQAAAAALEKLSGVLDEEPSVPEPANPVTREHWLGRIAFEDVTFAYRERNIFEHISVEIPAGQTVALVGPTGAGKSTFARLVARFYDPVSGRVTLDGVSLRVIGTEELHRRIVMVTQEGFLFSGTIRSNIAFGRPEASDAEIEQAARTVGAHDFIVRLPEGYDTDVRKRGGRLSAGQRQLVALARAFVADPQVLIFDEATSSVDLPSERLIQRALEVLLRDRTSLIIAHRLSTVEIADRVLVIEEGRVVEDGSPAQLRESGGRWRALQDAWVDSLA
jgi:ABC-type multidrug transport system fused ATPase/permease subunit